MEDKEQDDRLPAVDQADVLLLDAMGLDSLFETMVNKVAVMCKARNGNQEAIQVEPSAGQRFAKKRYGRGAR